MKYFSLFLLMFCFMNLNYETKAQHVFDICLPDCENDTWFPNFTQPALQIVVNIPGCGSVTVGYRYRIACGIWYDYYLEYVAQLNGDTNINNCLMGHYGNNLALLLQAATEQLILQNPANFPPNTPNDCEDNWRVLKGSCWHWDGYLGTGGGGPSSGGTIQSSADKDWYAQNIFWEQILFTCNDVFCCLEVYEVCTDGAGNRTITNTNYIPPPDPDCSESSHYCKPVCGSIYR
jgi:hypothetical protein